MSQSCVHCGGPILTDGTCMRGCAYNAGGPGISKPYPKKTDGQALQYIAEELRKLAAKIDAVS